MVGQIACAPCRKTGLVAAKAYAFTSITRLKMKLGSLYKTVKCTSSPPAQTPLWGSHSVQLLRNTPWHCMQPKRSQNWPLLSRQVNKAVSQSLIWPPARKKDTTPD